MDISTFESTGHVSNPDFRQIFEQVFEGGSTKLANDEAWLSVVGFTVQEVKGLWRRYGIKIMHGTQPVEPVHWLWLFSYLKSNLNWMWLSLAWRVPTTTFKRIVNSMMDSLEGMVDEVRAIAAVET